MPAHKKEHPKHYWLTVRVTEEERERIAAEARLKGDTITKHVRALLLPPHAIPLPPSALGDTFPTTYPVVASSE